MHRLWVRIIVSSKLILVAAGSAKPNRVIKRSKTSDSATAWDFASAAGALGKLVRRNLFSAVGLAADELRERSQQDLSADCQAACLWLWVNRSCHIKAGRNRLEDLSGAPMAELIDWQRDVIAVGCRRRDEAGEWVRRGGYWPAAPFPAHKEALAMSAEEVKAGVVPTADGPTSTAKDELVSELRAQVARLTSAARAAAAAIGAVRESMG